MVEIRTGTVLADKYRVERMLGTGGMGFVVAATHLHLEQIVALKFIRGGVVDNPDTLTRFFREARAASKLKSEHVARVLDVGSLATGEPFMVLEYLEGVDLSTLSKRGPVPLDEACEYVLQACEALAEAHALGIVHRDIKLANLFLTQGPAGVPLVKVLDFGISKEAFAMAPSPQLTAASAMLGSPRFMSPEQMLNASSVDARTDIWSLGVCLYRLVCGVAPFDAPVLGALLTQVMNETPCAPSQIACGIPPAFDAVVAKCLARDLDERYASVADLAADLAPYVSPRALGSAERARLLFGAPPSSPRAELPPQSGGTNVWPSDDRASSDLVDLNRTSTAPWTETTHAPKASHGRTVAVALALCAALGGAFAIGSESLPISHVGAPRPAETRRSFAAPPARVGEAIRAASAPMFAPPQDSARIAPRASSAVVVLSPASLPQVQADHPAVSKKHRRVVAAPPAERRRDVTFESLPHSPPPELEAPALDEIPDSRD